jgi:hypothetical protein
MRRCPLTPSEHRRKRETTICGYSESTSNTFNPQLSLQREQVLMDIQGMTISLMAKCAHWGVESIKTSLAIIEDMKRLVV